jgi:hypothetical protein
VVTETRKFSNKEVNMKYIAPAALSTVSAIALIQGSKQGQITDSSNPMERTNNAGYGEDE